MTDNNIQLNDRLGQDPKVLEKDDSQFVKLSVATTEVLKNEASGQDSKSTAWHDVLVYMPHVKAMTDGLQKGDTVHVSGSLYYKTVKSDKGFKIK